MQTITEILTHSNNILQYFTGKAVIQRNDIYNEKSEDFSPKIFKCKAKYLSKNTE